MDSPSAATAKSESKGSKKKGNNPEKGKAPRGRPRKPKPVVTDDKTTPPPTTTAPDFISKAKRAPPVGALMKRVIDLLKEKREPLRPEQINQVLDIDIVAHKSLFANLCNNPKIEYDGRRFSYKSKYGIEDKDDLLNFIRKFPDGVDMSQITDAYPTVLDDVQELRAARQIWLKPDRNESRAYPNDPRIQIEVDDDLKKLFHAIELPQDMLDIEKELRKNQMKSATDTAKRRSAEAALHFTPSDSKPKPRAIDFTKRRLTNVHLPELFSNPNVPRT